MTDPGRPTTPAAERGADGAERGPGELVTGLSPRQVIGGFAFVAAIILWLARRSRRSRSRREG